MKQPRLRAQLILVVALLQVYALGAGISFWFLHRAHSRLEESFHKDLTALSQLPRLRDQMRQLDFLTDRYLTAGRRENLPKRQEAIRQIYKILSDITPFLGVPEREILRNLDKRLSAYVAEQDQWIQRKQAGRLSTSGGIRLADREGLDSMLAEIIALKDANLSALQLRRDSLRETFRLTFILILLTGVAAGIFVAWFLSRYLVGPVAALQGHARRWSLGAPWTFSISRAGAEVQDLNESMKQMAGRLNQQFEKEHELNQFKTKLVSMVSHEFNNSLSVIGSAAILLEEGEAGAVDAERSRYYKILKSHTRSLGLLVANFLEMGRVESGHFAVKVQKTDTVKIVKECLERLEFLAEQKKHKVTLEAPSEPLYAMADPQALVLVVTNLANNAIKYTPKGGRISVRVALKGSVVRTEIEDTGMGISKEDLEKILSSFYRTEAGKKVAQGYGIGLSVTKSILEAQGSALKIESEPGRGSLFFFELPVAR